MIGYVASAAYSGVLTAVISGFRSAFAEVELVLIEMEGARVATLSWSFESTIERSEPLGPI
ncbi:hypothetical protein ASE66_24130 [Bosea sp. Root483D1]|uniref:hypothetical protein n=1 Tax=Bosea sp. Root483D1 TaxID=1736544 RepID=UPI00070ACDAF|nr:hypothetical protein [Bosea sp. Root483D1]KRE11617.1 hypothetical protein ASE66_24130 [Bosea sp. Root483D1]